MFATWKAKNQFHSRYQVIGLSRPASTCGSTRSMQSRGIENDDMLIVRNDRGAVRIMARDACRLALSAPHAHRRADRRRSTWARTPTR